MVVKQRIALNATGIWPGPDMLAAAGGVMLVLSPWLFLRRGRGWMVGAAILNLLLTLLIYADIVYYRQFGDLVSIASLRFATQLGTVADAVTSLMKRDDIWLWADVPVLFLLALIPTRWYGRLKHARLKVRTAAIMAAVGVVIVGGIAYFDPMLSAKYYGHSNVASRMGLVNYHLFDVGSYAERMSSRVLPSGGAVTEVKQWFAPHRAEAAKPPAPPLEGIAKGKNVIVIQVESLQAFPLNMVIDGQEVTPNLNKLAKESLNFTDFYTQTGQGVTSDADFLTNCSLHPTRTGAVYYDYAANDFRCMPTLLREHGYKAVAMQGMPPDFWNLASVYPHVGFEKFYNLKDGFSMDEKLGIGLSDESFFKQAVPHLKELKEPYYAFLVTLTSHGPFKFDGMPHTLKLGALEGTQAADYLHAVHYTDGAIGHFMAQLKAEGILDKSVIVLYGDHGGIFRQNSGMDELLKIPASDEVGLTRMEKRIPFLVRLPGGAQAGERTFAAGQADTAPTLAALLGVPTDSVYFMGRNLLRQQDGVVAYYTGSAMTNKNLYWAKDGGGKCYDRASGAEVGLDTCANIADEAAKRLSISRLIVERNLIPDLMKKK